MNEQQNFWANEYASDYIRKNLKFDHKKGVEGWRLMLNSTNGITSILECGCNIGRNIDFLKDVCPSASKSIIEISKPAFDLVTKEHNFVNAWNGSIIESSFSEKFDLVFTNGVLIHIHPNDLLANMEKIFSLSKKYILIAEYFNRTPVMLYYQGKKDMLFTPLPP